MKRMLWLFLLLVLVRVDAQSLIPAMNVSFDMGMERKNWTHAKWEVVPLVEAVSLAGLEGVVVTVTTDNPRGDVGVTIGLREKDGTWYTHPWASDLSAASQTSTLRFKNFSLPAYHQPPQGGFKDENDRLDPEQIDAVAIGVVNPLGVGDVSFRVVSVLPGAAVTPVSDKPIPVRVTGQLLSINGTDTLPAGVFGAFNLGTMRNPESGEMQKRTDRYRLAMDKTIDFSMYGSAPAYGSEMTPMIVKSVGDRTQVSRRLEDADWERKYQQSGTALGEAVVADGRTAYIEFWNEPYLNWANDNRVNFDPKFYNVNEAEEGGVVKIRHDGEVMPHLKWTKEFGAPGWNWTRAGLQEWRRGKDGEGKMPLWEHARPYKTPHHIWRRNVQESNPPNSVKDGETYTVNGKTYTAFTPWHIYDETQFTYWSGEGMLKPYIDPLLVYATAAKAVAGDKVQIIAGWGNRPSEDHWAGFTMLYKPTIDAAIEVIDGYNDHDYGSDPQLMAANYEVVTGYAQSRYGKWLYAYNTETASNADPQAVGEVKVSGDAHKFQWVSRKIATLLDLSADKCRALAHFGVGGGFWSDGGEGVAMDLMRNLRGRLVYTQDPLHDLIVVSAIDGTDPMAPRPEDLPDRQELVTLLLNDSSDVRKIALQVVPPVGTQFVDGTIRRGVPDWETGKPVLDEKTLPVTPEVYRLELSLEPKVPYILTLGLNGKVDVDAPVQVTQTQTFGDEFVQPVTPESHVSMAIEVANPKAVGRAYLRFVADHIRPGEADVVINGVRIALPEVVAPENASLVVQIPLPDTVELQEKNAVSFLIRDPKQAGFLLGSASLIVEQM
jgi:hypothetical protein